MTEGHADEEDTQGGTRRGGTGGLGIQLRVVKGG